MFVKFLAWYSSGSQAILSDALESLINIATSIFTLYSLIYASKLKDQDHPYGHGKVEYLTVGFEGALIFGTGIFIIYQSILDLIQPSPLKDVDLGLILTAVSAIAMWYTGAFLRRKGDEFQSLSLKADGQHFRTDALTSIGLLAGLLLFKLTGWIWVDPLLAILLALHIMFSGFQLIKESIDRLLDKADITTIEKLSQSLQLYRNDAWIDVHNLRLQKFGHYLHVDCHLTLPFYYTLDEVHRHIKILESDLNRDFNNHVELFVHTDPCQQIPCNICSVHDCSYRKAEFVKKIDWNTHNLMQNKKHKLHS
ncbi:MAG: cation transporter [Bacteroidetes bacterium]|nr:cation transporter [Bacteroidota bacterium]MBK9399399.1 cation transporter [Bacteroidota bacterium]MBL0097263.1 cation transporter [Bacteroidota bacterium]